MLEYIERIELDELSEDDAVVDYTYLAEDKFLLIALLSRKGYIQILYELGGDRAKRCIVCLPSLWGRPIDPVSICIGPEAAFLVIALADGDVLIVPIKLILDVSWGSSALFADNSVQAIAVSSSCDACLRTPTCVLTFTPVNSSSPCLLIANKSGQVLIVDLVTRKVAIEVQAPESIHNIDVFKNSNSSELLVTGFTGAQWIVPLENGGRSVRETLSTLIPSDLHALQPPSALVMRSGEGVVRVDNESGRAEVFASLHSLVASCSPPSTHPFSSLPSPAPLSFQVQSGTWSVSITSKVVFALSHECAVQYKLRFGISTDKSAECEWYGVPSSSTLPALGMITRAEKALSMPSCFVVTHKGLVRIAPEDEENAEQWLLDSVLFRKYPPLERLSEVCELMSGSGGKEVAHRILNSILERYSKGKSILPTAILAKVVTIAKHLEMSFNDLVTMMERFGLEHMLLPQILLRVECDPRENVRWKVVGLFVRCVEKGAKRADDADCALSCFLCRHTDVREGLADVLRVGLWRSAALLLPRDNSNSRIVLSYLLENGVSSWQKGDATTRALLLCLVWPLQWEQLPAAEVSQFMQQLTSWQVDVSGDASVHRKSALLAQTNMHRCAAACRPLFVLSSLLAAASSSVSSPPAPPQLIATGLNCSAAVCVDRRLVLWGELSSVQSKVLEEDVLPDNTPTPKNSPAHGKKSSLPPQNSMATPAALEGVEVQVVSCGAEHVLVLSTDGRLFSWGRNRYGQCGVGHADPVTSPTEVEGEWKDALCVSAGQLHSALLLSDGRSLFTWGWAFYGQLGLSERSDRSADVHSPCCIPHLPEAMRSVSCGRVHTVCVGESGSVWVVGGGAYGQLATTRDIPKQFTFIKVEGVSNVVLAETKFYQNVAVTEDGRIFEWGKNPQELKMKMFVMRRLRNNAVDKSNKAPLPVRVPKDFLGVHEVGRSVEGTVVAVSTGLSHSALLTKDGHLYTWGKGLDFQLGHGGKSERSEPTRLVLPEGIVWTSVHCGGNHTIVSSNDGRLWSFGRNDVGQCGVPLVKGPSTPRKYFFQAKEGSKRCVQLADDSAFVPSPTLVPTVTVREPDVWMAMDRDVLLRCLREMDVAACSTLSRLLSSLPLHSPSSALIHLLSADVPQALQTLIHLQEQRSAEGGGTVGSTVGEVPSALLSVLWDVVGNHEEWHTRSVLSCALGGVERRGAGVASRQMRALHPSVWSNHDTLSHTTVADRLSMLQTWNPPPSLPAHTLVSSSSLAGPGRARVHSSCGHVVDVSLPSSLPSSPAQSQSLCEPCSICIQEWKDLVQQSANL